MTITKERMDQMHKMVNDHEKHNKVFIVIDPASKNTVVVSPIINKDKKEVGLKITKNLGGK